MMNKEARDQLEPTKKTEKEKRWKLHGRMICETGRGQDEEPEYEWFHYSVEPYFIFEFGGHIFVDRDLDVTWIYSSDNGPISQIILTNHDVVAFFAELPPWNETRLAAHWYDSVPSSFFACSTGKTPDNDDSEAHACIERIRAKFRDERRREGLKELERRNTVSHTLIAYNYVDGSSDDYVTKDALAKAIMQQTGCEKSTAYRHIDLVEKEELILRGQTTNHYSIARYASGRPIGVFESLTK